MAATLLNSGPPSASDITTYFDALAKVLKYTYATIGTGAPNESGTLMNYLMQVRNTQINNTVLRQKYQQTVDSSAVLLNYPALVGFLRKIFTDTNSQIQFTQPAGWNLQQTGHSFFDSYLTRLNANSASVPATPGYTVTLTATTGGAIPPTTAGSEPRCKITLVSTVGDWVESQPTAASAQVALTGKNDAWTLGGLTGNVPASVGKLRVYRQFDANAGASDPYYWDQDVAVTAGQPWSNYTVTLSQPDQQLNQGYSPPVWLQCLLLPEEAAMIAAAFSNQPGTATPYALPVFVAASMLSPGNVAANPENGYLGIGNTSASAEFGRWVATVYTQGAPATANVPAQCVQGFGGAYGLQARTTATLNNAASITNVNYTYVNASNPTTPQSGTLAGAFSLGTVVGNTVSFAVPAGNLVQTVTGLTVGAATTGTFVVEPIAVRAI